MKLGFAAGKIYAVVGMGKTGRATAAALRESGASVVTWDDKNHEAGAPHFSDWDWATLDAIVMSPGIAWYYPAMHPIAALAQQHGLPLIGDIELLYLAQPKAKYIAITGTNGKSTTTTLIAHILAQCGVPSAVGGNLGTPVLDLPELGEGGTYVLELSSYQLDLLHSTRFNVAVWLNISPDHLDHHGSMERYVAAKQHIFDRQKKADVAVLGVDDATSEQVAKEMRAAKQQCVIPISTRSKLASGIEVRDGILTNRFALTEPTGDLRSIKALQGEHNWQNAAAAYAACFAHGLAHDAIMQAMQSYPGLKHRMQWLGEIAGVTFVNDSKATNADAAEKALRTYDNIYWIAGGVAKEGGIEPLRAYFPKICRTYLIGEAAPTFAQTLNGQDVVQAGTLAEAFARAVADAPAGSAIVLSPACASFDQFANFEVRGDAFIALVDAHRAKRGAA
ncbi:MAG: UDP-N-acetylmuramoyl-L-alanine--D-glutamate ligase [Azospirillum brasilense]|nr:MAG: UDP-N-acetylmuramoyl-L-alanine--D-glutamate ligase [Azospirillum brasilense]